MSDSESFKFQRRVTGTTPAGGNTKDVEITNVWELRKYH